jgi:hypothetical protein
MRQLIIGLSGPAGAGKDTAADAIVDYAKRIGTGRKLSFADPMRAMLEALGVPPHYMTDRSLKERPVPALGRSYRQLAQTLGTEWGRGQHGDDFWVKALALRAEAAKEDILVIPDVRFPNEARWIETQGGFLVHVSRPGVAPIEAHASETSMAGVPIWQELHNEGSIPEFQHLAVGVLCDAIRARVKAKNVRSAYVA